MKPNTTKHAPFALAPLATALPLIFVSHFAQADCSESTLGSIAKYSCINTPQTKHIVANKTTETDITATNWNLGQYSLYVVDSDPSRSKISFTGDQVSSINSTGNVIGNGIIHLAGNGDVSTTIANSNIEANGYYHGLAAHALIGGAVTMSVTDTDINMINSASGAVVGANEGKVAGASINIETTNGHFTSNTGKGISANIGGLGGDITIKTTNTTIDAATFGIDAQTVGKTGKVDIINNSNINVNNTAVSTDFIIGINATGGKVSIQNSGSITASAPINGNAIKAFSSGDAATGGGVTIISHGDLSATDSAIFSEVSGLDAILSVTVSGKIETGHSAAGLRDAIELYGINTNNHIKVDFQSGSIETFDPAGTTLGARGISANSLLGTIGITTASGTTIKTASNQSEGIIATAGGIININNGSDITTTGSSSGGISALGKSGNVNITSIGKIKALGDYSTGIYGQTTDGNINIKSDGDIAVSGILTTATKGVGIFGTSTSGKVIINASHNISTNYGTTGQNADAIRAYSGTGDVFITYDDDAGTLSTVGDYGDAIQITRDTTSTAQIQAIIAAAKEINIGGSQSQGIFIGVGSGNVNVINHATLMNIGSSSTDNSNGIAVTNINAGNINIVSTSDMIIASNKSSPAILADAQTGKVDIIASGQIKTTGGASVANASNHGISSTSTTGDIHIQFIDPNSSISTLGQNSNGINTVSTGGNTLIENATAINTQGSGSSAIYSKATGGSININLGENANIQGGYGVNAAGISLDSSANSTLSNSGIIGALNDMAIHSNISSNQLNITNKGTITGTINAESTALTFNNLSSNSWDIRNFADTDGDGIREEKGIAVSSFGGNANSVLNNEISGVIRLSSVTTETSVNTANQYLGAENLSTYDTVNSGVMQGQILGLARFENRGMIDLTGGSNVAGNLLVISGGNTAGSNGGGTYVSDGGSLNMNVVLNDGAENTKSDLLVVDNALRASGGATKILVNPADGSVSAFTKGDGIKLVEVAGTSSKDSFALGHRVVSGPLEYLLYQNSMSNPSNQSWYLRNVTPDGKPIYNAAVGSYLGNQTAAVGMFMHTLHDRIGEPQFTEANKADVNAPSAWVRIVSNKADSKAGSGTLDQSTDTNLIHFGGELAKWQNDTNRLHFGLMGAYGESKTDTSSNITGVSSTGKVDGYSFGAYATWYGNKDLPTGPYVDGWLQYGTFKNKVNASGQNQEEYDSNVFTASVEAGYAFIMKDAYDRQWMIEPQVQVAYNQYNADDHIDAAGMRVSGNDASGLVTRVGARAYSRTKVGNGIQPFVEANWWHSDANNSLSFNNITISDDTPSDRFELKLGLQGEIAKNWQAWGHIGAQAGQDSYSRYEGMVGIKHIF